MLTLVQLSDGCYKVIIDYSADVFSVHKEYIFEKAESSADPDPSGECIRLAFKTE